MKAYSVLSSVYDTLFDGDKSYQKWLDYVIKAVERYTPLNLGIDVGAGTGRVTRALKENGFDVTGVDNSVEMLNVAAAFGGVNYVLQDVKRLNGFHDLGFITAVNDVINYLPKKDLDRVFNNFNKALTKGGFLLFDISTEHKLKNVLGNNMFAEDLDDVTYLWFNTLRKDSVKMDLSFFFLSEDQRYERRDETHVQYIHKIDFIVESLKNNGFSVIKITDSFGKTINPHSFCDKERAVFHCVKV